MESEEPEAHDEDIAKFLTILGDSIAGGARLAVLGLARLHLVDTSSVRLDRQSAALEKRMQKEGCEHVLRTLVKCLRAVVSEMAVPGAPEAITGDPREAAGAPAGGGSRTYCY